MVLALLTTEKTFAEGTDEGKILMRQTLWERGEEDA
jgi:hypothetical protein